MERKVLPDGFIELKSKHGILDRRTRLVHPEAVVDPKNERFFMEIKVSDESTKIDEEKVEEIIEPLTTKKRTRKSTKTVETTEE